MTLAFDWTVDILPCIRQRDRVLRICIGSDIDDDFSERLDARIGRAGMPASIRLP